MNMYIWLCKDTGTMNRPLRLAVCSLGVSWCVRSIIGSPSAAVGADLSCPHIRIRHAFANCLKCIHGTFATCSLSVCYIIAIQKYGFCVAKVWFLSCKKGGFTLQKYGSYNSKVWFLFLLCNSVHNQ